MKLKILSTLIPFVWVANVFGGISDHKVHLHASGGKLICDVDFGFHFNTKAPTSLEVDGKKYQPSSKEEKSLGFKRLRRIKGLLSQAQTYLQAL